MRFADIRQSLVLLYILGCWITLRNAGFIRGHAHLQVRIGRKVHCPQGGRQLAQLFMKQPHPSILRSKHFSKSTTCTISMPVLPRSRSQLLNIRANDSSERSTSSTFSVNCGAARCGTSTATAASAAYGVHFKLESNSIHEISARSELSRDEYSQLWYTEEDLKVIRSDLRIVTRMMKSGRFEEDADLCFRGIELDREKDQRADRQATILMELFWWKIGNFFDSEVPSKLQKLTFKAKRDALVRAKQDQEAAMNIYRHRR